jgi:hypothetical protein
VATLAGTWLAALLPFATLGLLIFMLASNDCVNFWRF